MAMKRSQRMTVVLQLAEREEQQAADQLSASRQQLGGAEQQLQQLQDYRQDYISRINAKVGAQPVQQMLADRSFVGQLENAVDVQRQKLRQAQVQHQQLMQVWQVAYRKRVNLEELIARIQHDESLEGDKRLQKELDELSSIKHQRKSST